MAEQLANNASTTLNGAINNSTTSVVVTDGSVFPSTGNFRVLINSELMICSARSGNTLTVSRGDEGSAADAHANGEVVEHLFTKGSFEQILADYDQVGGYASRPSAPRKGTIFTADDLPYRWYYNGTNWDMIQPLFVPHAKQWDTTGWTAQNQSTATFTAKNRTLNVTTMPISNSNIRGYSRSMPSTPYKATLILPHQHVGIANASWYLGHREASTGKLKVMFASGSGGGQTGVEQWNTFASFNSTVQSGRRAWKAIPQYMRVENDGTNFNYSLSFDGKYYLNFYSEAKTLWFTTAADQIFFGAFLSAGYAGTNQPPSLHLLGYWEE